VGLPFLARNGKGETTMLRIIEHFDEIQRQRTSSPTKFVVPENDVKDGTDHTYLVRFWDEPYHVFIHIRNKSVTLCQKDDEFSHGDEQDINGECEYCKKYAEDRSTNDGYKRKSVCEALVINATTNQPIVQLLQMNRVLLAEFAGTLAKLGITEKSELKRYMFEIKAYAAKPGKTLDDIYKYEIAAFVLRQEPQEPQWRERYKHLPLTAEETSAFQIECRSNTHAEFKTEKGFIGIEAAIDIALKLPQPKKPKVVTKVVREEVYEDIATDVVRDELQEAIAYAHRALNGKG